MSSTVQLPFSASAGAISGQSITNTTPASLIDGGSSQFSELLARQMNGAHRISGGELIRQAGAQEPGGLAPSGKLLPGTGNNLPLSSLETPALKPSGTDLLGEASANYHQTSELSIEGEFQNGAIPFDLQPISSLVREAITRLSKEDSVLSNAPPGAGIFGGASQSPFNKLTTTGDQDVQRQFQPGKAPPSSYQSNIAADINTELVSRAPLSKLVEGGHQSSLLTESAVTEVKPLVLHQSRENDASVSRAGRSNALAHSISSLANEQVGKGLNEAFDRQFTQNTGATEKQIAAGLSKDPITSTLIERSSIVQPPGATQTGSGSESVQQLVKQDARQASQSIVQSVLNNGDSIVNARSIQSLAETLRANASADATSSQLSQYSSQVKTGSEAAAQTAAQTKSVLSSEHLTNAGGVLQAGDSARRENSAGYNLGPSLSQGASNGPIDTNLRTTGQTLLNRTMPLDVSAALPAAAPITNNPTIMQNLSLQQSSRLGSAATTIDKGLQLEASSAELTNRATDLHSESGPRPIVAASATNSQFGSNTFSSAAPVNASFAMNLAEANATVANSIPQIGQRIQWMLGNGTPIAEIRIDPPELGALQIQVSSDDKQASVSFLTQTSAAKELIEANLPRLREHLESLGLELGETSVDQEQKQNSDDAQLAELGAENAEGKESEVSDSSAEPAAHGFDQSALTTVDAYA